MWKDVRRMRVCVCACAEELEKFLRLKMGFLVASSRTPSHGFIRAIRQTFNSAGQKKNNKNEPNTLRRTELLEPRGLDKIASGYVYAKAQQDSCFFHFPNVFLLSSICFFLNLRLSFCR